MRRNMRRIVVSGGAILVALLLSASTVAAITASWVQYGFGSLLPQGKFSAYTKFPLSPTPNDAYFSWVWDQTNANGRVLRYYPFDNTWTPLTTGQDEGYPTPREGACWAQTWENSLHQQRLALFGGRRYDNGALTTEWNIFNLATRKWEMKRDSGAYGPSARWYIGCDSLKYANSANAAFYGGWDINKVGIGAGGSDTIWLLGPCTDPRYCWSGLRMAPPIPTTRGDFMMVTADPLNDRFYVWGGKSGTAYISDPIWIDANEPGGLPGWHASSNAGTVPSARAGASVAVAFHPETAKSGWVMYGGYSGASETTLDEFYNMQVNTGVNVFTWAKFTKSGTWPPTTRNAIFVCAESWYGWCKQTPGVTTRYTLVPLFSQNANFWRVTATF